MVTPRKSSRNGLSRTRCITGPPPAAAGARGGAVSLVLMPGLLSARCKVVSEISINSAPLFWYSQYQFMPAAARGMRYAPAGKQRIVLRRLPRPAIGALLGLAAALAAGGWPLRSGGARPAHAVVLIYVGAEDCAPCRAWRRGPGAEFRASAEFLRLTYREVEAPT